MIHNPQLLETVVPFLFEHFPYIVTRIHLFIGAITPKNWGSCSKQSKFNISVLICFVSMRSFNKVKVVVVETRSGIVAWVLISLSASFLPSFSFFKFQPCLSVLFFFVSLFRWKPWFWMKGQCNRTWTPSFDAPHPWLNPNFFQRLLSFNLLLIELVDGN